MDSGSIRTGSKLIAAVVAVDRFKLPSLLILAAALQLHTSFHTTPHVDEKAHLASGVLAWKTGNQHTYRVNPPLVRMLAALPHLHRRQFQLTGGVDRLPYRTEFIAGGELAEQLGPSLAREIRLSRLMVFPFWVLATLLVAYWVTEITDAATGRLAAVLLAFNPMFLGWSATLTPDVPASATGLLATFCCYRWLSTGCHRWAVRSGVCLGGAILTKSVWLLLPFLWLPLTAAVLAVRRSNRPTVIKYWTQWTLITTTSVLVLCLGYDFHGCETTIANVPLQSCTLTRCRSELLSVIPNVGRLPVLLPLDFIIGIDVQKQDFEVGDVSFIGGCFREEGVWWFYLYVWLVKTPVPLLIVFVAALISPVVVRRNHFQLERQGLLWMTIVAFALVLFSQSGLSQHGRYSLMILPMVIVCLTSTIGTFTQRKLLRRSLMFWSIAVATLSSPGLTSFYNVPSGGSKHGHMILLGSDTEWGQEYPLLVRWKEENMPDEVLWYILHRNLRPDLLGSDASQLRHAKLSSESDADLPAGWYAVSVDVLHEFPKKSLAGQIFRQLTPVDQVGNTMMIFHLENPVSPRVVPDVAQAP